jgi:hypothetical protein
VRRALLAVAALAVALAATVPAGADLIPVTQVRFATSKGVGQVRIGSTLERLQELKLVGGARKGCELSPGERVAPLKPPLEGFAVFYPKNRVISVGATGGAITKAGVTIGTSAAKAQRAYPAAPYDPPPGPRAPFEVGFLWIGGRIHPRMTLIVDSKTHKVTEIAVPFPNICE